MHKASSRKLIVISVALAWLLGAQTTNAAPAKNYAPVLEGWDQTHNETGDAPGGKWNRRIFEKKNVLVTLFGQQRKKELQPFIDYTVPKMLETYSEGYDYTVSSDSVTELENGVTRRDMTVVINNNTLNVLYLWKMNGDSKLLIFAFVRPTGGAATVDNKTVSMVIDVVASHNP